MAKETSRDFCLQFFRSPEWYAEIRSVHPPIDPSTSWIGEMHVLSGLNPNVSPPVSLSNRNTARTGRIVRWEVNKSKEERISLVYAIFCANIIDTEPPPYVGGHPKQLELYRHPLMTFSDGTMGKWDARKYTQLDNSQRPWTCFHKAPASYSMSQSIHYQNIFYFWSWYSELDPLQGGWWSSKKLEVLFKQRTRLEDAVQKLIERLNGKIDLTPYTLPWNDTLNLQTALAWTMFREGRDALAYTTRYMAEIEAFTFWLGRMADVADLKESGEWKSVSMQTCEEGDAQFAGTWAPTITSVERWDFLAFCRVPIYMIIEVPRDHPFYNIAVVGNLDNDERYRINAYDFCFKRRNNPVQLRVWQFASYRDLLLESRVKDLPVALTVPSGETENSSVPFRSWKTPVYRDINVCRSTRPLDRQESWKRSEERALFASLPPNSRVLNASSDQHPLLVVLPETRDPGITYYMEANNPDSDSYWPVKYDSVEPPEDNLVEPTNGIVRYRFYFPYERICILSFYPFPGRDVQFGRTQWYSEIERSCELPSWLTFRDYLDSQLLERPRKYYLKEPTSIEEKPAHLWTPTDEQANSSVLTVQHDVSRTAFTTSSSLNNMQNSVILDLPFIVPSIVIKQPGLDSGSATLDMPRHVAHIDASAKSEDVRELQEGRRLLAEQVSRRFFNPRHAYKSNRLVAWAIPTVTDRVINGAFCFPIRIANMPGQVTIDDVFGLLEAFELGGVVLYTCCIEADTTLTVDIGLRYAEDALHIWVSLPGYSQFGRYIEVYPITHLAGKIVVPDFSFVERFIEERREVHAVASDTYVQLGLSDPGAFQDLDELDRLLASSNLADQTTTSTSPSQAAIATTGHLGFPWQFSLRKGTLPAVLPNLTLASVQVHRIPPVTPAASSIASPGTVEPIRQKAKRREEPDRLTEAARLSPENVSNMSSKERKNWKRNVTRAVNDIRDAWESIFLLPEFHPPKPEPTERLVPFCKALWAWKDTCYSVMCEFREKTQHPYDYSPFEDALGELVRLRDVYGCDFTECSAKLREHQARRM